jgi:hypothetical protein
MMQDPEITERFKLLQKWLLARQKAHGVWKNPLHAPTAIDRTQIQKDIDLEVADIKSVVMKNMSPLESVIRFLRIRTCLKRSTSKSIFTNLSFKCEPTKTAPVATEDFLEVFFWDGIDYVDACFIDELTFQYGVDAYIPLSMWVAIDTGCHITNKSEVFSLMCLSYQIMNRIFIASKKFMCALLDEIEAHTLVSAQDGDDWETSGMLPKYTDKSSYKSSWSFMALALLYIHHETTKFKNKDISINKTVYGFYAQQNKSHFFGYLETLQANA